MKRILIAYDGSSCAQTALEELSRAGLPAQLEVMILSVAEVWLPPESPTPPSASEPVLDIMIAAQQAREAARQKIEQNRPLAEHAAGRLRSLFPHWKVTPKTIGNSPAWGIVMQATQWGADLIVLGSRGRSMMRSFFLGSVSHKVAVEAPCSVHIARTHQSPGAQRILLAVDGSSASMTAVRAVVARAWLPGAVVQLFTAVDPQLLVPPSWSVWPTEPWMQPGRKGTEWLERTLDVCAQQLHSAGLAVETRLLEGRPEHLLLQQAQAWDTDCIFLGAHGLHHERRALGSLATAIATRAHCSVEIVRDKVVSRDHSEAFLHVEAGP